MKRIMELSGTQGVAAVYGVDIKSTMGYEPESLGIVQYFQVLLCCGI